MPDDRAELQSTRLRVERSAHINYRGSPMASTHWHLYHGYGERSAEMLDRCDALQDDARFLIAPEGLSRFYTDRASGGKIGASWMTSADREEEIADYLRYARAVIGWSEGNHRESGSRPRRILLGFSQGASTAARVALFGPDEIDHLVIWGGALEPAEWQESRKIVGLHVTVVAGRSDRIVRLDRLQGVSEHLESLGAAVRLVEFDGAHEIDPGTLKEIAHITDS